MARAGASLSRTISFAARLLTAAAVVLPPSIYFALSYEHAAGLIEAEAEINARIVTRVISGNPDLWEYEQVRFSEYLGRRPSSGDAERRRIVGPRGAIVAEISDPLPRPWLTRSVPLFDSGVRVGAVEVSRSLQPLLFRSGVLALGLLVAGLLSYRAVRTLPLQAIERSLEHEAQLEQQLRTAQRLETLGRLVGGIAHDFNNVLTVIAAKAGLLRRKLQDDSVRRYADDILASTERAAALTADLLTVGGRRPLRAEPLDLAQHLRGFEPSLRDLLREGVELRAVLPQRPLPIMAEAAQLERVLMNLVKNAQDAMPAGGRIVLTAARTSLAGDAAARAGVDAPGEYAELSVADTGSGIPAEARARIFEPFFTTKEPGKGTGLGLSIAYGIVKQHGGSIRVESEPGQGATFTLLLPLTEHPAPAAAGPAAPAASARA